MIANSDQRTMYANRMGDNPINHADKCCVVVGTIFFVLLVVVVVFLERKYEDRCIRSENDLYFRAFKEKVCSNRTFIEKHFNQKRLCCDYIYRNKCQTKSSSHSYSRPDLKTVCEPFKVFEKFTSSCIENLSIGDYFKIFNVYSYYSDLQNGKEKECFNLDPSRRPGRYPKN